MKKTPSPSNSNTNEMMTVLDPSNEDPANEDGGASRDRKQSTVRFEIVSPGLVPQRTPGIDSEEENDWSLRSASLNNLSEARGSSKGHHGANQPQPKHHTNVVPADSKHSSFFASINHKKRFASTPTPIHLKPISCLNPSTLSPLTAYLHDLLLRHRDNHSGSVASYIPALESKSNPDHCAISVVTLGGDCYSVGDVDVEFTIQAVSNMMTFDLALSRFGREGLCECVGLEPTGEPFNSLRLVNNKPANPLVNAGAIQIASMIDDFSRVLEHCSNFAGRQLRVDEEIMQSEMETGHRNVAIAHLLVNFELLKDEVENSIQRYLKQCSLLVTTRDLATVAATFANSGVNPFTGQIVTKPSNIHMVTSIMAACGMCAGSGIWLCDVGLPAKSGISGGISCIVPGVMGIGVYSPRVDEFGNSVRGFAICKELSETFGLSLFHPQANALASLFIKPEIRPLRVDLSHLGVECTAMWVDGAVSINAVEEIAKQFALPENFHARVFLIHLSDRSKIDASGLVLLDWLSRLLRETNRTLLVCLDLESSIALKLGELIGVDAVIGSEEQLEIKLISLGILTTEEQIEEPHVDPESNVRYLACPY